MNTVISGVDSSTARTDFATDLGNRLGLKSPAHRLLLRQLKRCGIRNLAGDWRVFVDAVNEAYWQSDNDRDMLERSLDLSSMELLQANEEMHSMVTELRQGQRDYQGLFESACDAILILSPEEKKVLEGNQRACNMYGFSEQELVGLDLSEIADIELVGSRMRDILEAGSLPAFETIHRRKDGTEMLVEIHASLVQYQDRQAILSINRDITERVQAQKELEESLSLLQATLESTADGLLVVDHQGHMVAFNRQFVQMWQIPDEILVSRDDALALMHVQAQLVDPEAYLAKVRKLYEEPEAESRDIFELLDGRCFERDSKPQRVGGQSVGRVWSFRDISAHKRAEALIHHRAYHDELTDLPNRRMFKDRLRKAIAHAQRTNKGIAVLFLDIDRFKTINDTLGHAAGDQLLEEVARRLVQRRRAGDTLSRVGGDEFLVLVQDLEQPADAAVVAERMLEILRPPIRLEQHELFITASIGISIFPHDGSDVETLIKNADVAMYRAKTQGRNTYRIYTPEMNARAFELLMLENRLRRALEREEFVLYYQPQMGALSGEMSGVEALVRWRQPDGGLVPPGDFIAMAEETGQILALGEWVLREACRQGRVWLDRGETLSLAVNLSAHEFRRSGFFETITGALTDTGFPAHCLELELTESAIMEDSENGIESLRRLRELGIRIAIDDFGTGHSSLAYLKTLPIDTLKIDRSFILDCHDDPKDGAIVAAIIWMARSLQLTVVGEGVEIEAQGDFLRSSGCDVLQGYFFSHPVEAPALDAFFARQAEPEEA